MVCKVFFAKNFRKKAGNRETNCPECFLRTQCRANAAKARKKADFSQHLRGSRKVQTFRVKNAVSGCRFTPGKAFARAALQAEEAPHPSPLQG